ncbi:MAG TPA: outer membrane protein transport protein [Burkholderiales bacterium]|nr:outer membrane protein transport protein [Burkholderiales bacterium]
MRKDLLFKPAVAVAVAAMFGAAAHGALAAGFALNEQSVSGLGVAFAGGAASGEDASTVFYNPAAMTRISGTQAVVGVHGILPDATFTNQGSVTVGGPLTGGNGGDLAKSVGVPNFYLVTDINPNIKYGFGVSVPFGLTTAYDGNWVGRYQALKSEIKTVNLNPSLAYKVNERISVGAGFNAQYINAELSNAIDFGLLLGAPQSRDGAVNVSGNDWSFGYNLGVLFQLPTDTRVGLAYRSKIHHTVVGNASFTNVPPVPAIANNPRFQSGGINAAVTLPDSMSLSVVQGVGERWELLSDVTFTRWSYFNRLVINFNNAPSTPSITQENWRNTFRASIGATYRYSDVLKLRGGVGFDQSPVRGAFRTARIPDNHRKILAAGANYKVSKAGSVDFAYQRLFANDAAINNNQLATGGGRLIGNYSLDVNILSLQYNHNF